MRHIKRYEEFETHPYHEPVKEVRRELKDEVLDAQSYPSEQAEDRSYEVLCAAQRYRAGEISRALLGHLLEELNSDIDEMREVEYLAELERLKKQSKGLI